MNPEHHVRRRAFSYAHEYCHALADRERINVVSKTENREELFEVRANAFAAAFLMPENGVRAFVRAIGKGEPSRSVLWAYSEGEAVEGQRRVKAYSQDIQVYDVVHLVHHFVGVSYEVALHRLRNLRLLSEDQHRQLIRQQEPANAIRDLLEPKSQGIPQERLDFRHQLLFLALEAFRQELISRGKLRELCAPVHLSPEEIEDPIVAIESEAKPGREERAIYIPRER